MKKGFELLLLIFFLGNSSAWAKSVAEMAKFQRSKNLKFLIFLETPIGNFGSLEQKQKYADIRFDYSRSLTFYFEDDFREAYRGFLDVLESLEGLYEELSINYVDRVNSILQEAVRALVEVDIKYNRDADIINRILQDIEPPYEKPYYEETEFHFVYDKKAMTSSMDRAYYLLGLAKQLRREGVSLDRRLEANRTLPPPLRVKRVENYMKAVSLCRKAKLNGIRVYQLIYRNRLVEAQKEYWGNPTFYEHKIDPVFDTRVPEDYVVDLNDAKNRLHGKEIRYKIQLERYDKKTREEYESKNKNR